MTDVAQVDDLHVASVGAPDAHLNVLVFMGLRACVDAFELRRLEVLAEEWDARVTVVDTPGYGRGAPRLSRSGRTGLLRGDFTEVARRMVNAAAEFEPALRRLPATIVGYSLGTSIAAAAAADPGLVRVRHMVAVEPVAMRVCNPVRLLSMARSEDAYVADYRMRNPDSENCHQSDGSAARTDLALLGYALSRGGLTRDLLRSRPVQRFGLQIVHGADSLLSPKSKVAQLVSSCRRAGFDVRDVTVEGRHALWQSYSDVASIARRTGDLVRGQSQNEDDNHQRWRARPELAN